MSDVPIAQPTLDPAAVITADTPCVICGYNLRGLKPGGRCPECGSPVDRSVHGNLLRYADRGWLEKVFLGIRLMLWSILLTILVVVTTLIAAALGAPPVILLAAQFFLAGIDLAAAFLVTAQEPSIALSEDTVTLRKTIRACAAAACLGQLLQAIGELAALDYWLSIAAHVLSLAAVVAYFGKFVYLRRFALRIPNAKLARSTKIVMWGFVIGGGGVILVGFVGLLVMVAAGFVPGSGSAGTPVESIFAVLFRGTMCVAGVSALVFAIWYLILLFDYRDAFRLAIAEVRSFESRTAGG